MKRVLVIDAVESRRQKVVKMIQDHGMEVSWSDSTEILEKGVMDYAAIFFDKRFKQEISLDAILRPIIYDGMKLNSYDLPENED